MILKDLAQIISGYNFRTGTNLDENGKYFIIQVKDIKPSAELKYTQLRKIHLDQDLVTPAILRPGDVFISARGIFKAGFIGNNCPNNIVATSSIYIIRVQLDKILPQFLAIYLNTDGVQKTLTKLTSGSTLPAVPKAGFEDLIIQLPSLQKQHEIIEIHTMRQSYIQLIEQKQKLIDENLKFLIKSKLHI